MPATPSLNRGKRLAFWSVLLLSLAAFAWLASVVARATAGYLYVKTQPPGWRGRVLRPDPVLGVAPIPGATGEEIIASGFGTPVRFDREGLRIPVHAPPRGRPRPAVMALGCSFTFGSGCNARETYPARVAHALGGRTLNAAFPGYGLAQMLVQARELVPRHRPEILLVQASPWLPARAARRVRRTRFDLLPTPYFVTGEGGKPQWRPPLFASKALQLPISPYRETDRALLDWASFVGRIGFPLFLHDDALRLYLHVGRKAGTLPPGAPEQAISRLVYPEILRLCRESGTRMVVVVLEGAGRWTFQASDLGLPPDVLVVDTKPGLYAGLHSADAETYLRAYGQWRGTPPHLVDEHPNARAHAIIAEQVLAELGRDLPGTPVLAIPGHGAYGVSHSTHTPAAVGPTRSGGGPTRAKRRWTTMRRSPSA
ncbi:MAG TPA: hypothetical protein VFV75_06320 [Candidatus Polarisedimenticolaceae bacterium]|nr:hypothetical protein [Candidatus Polarisedimenticolaceae bacterium]